jgi:hypothetical protein
MSYALLPIETEIPFKTCLALESIATLLSSQLSPPQSIVRLLLQSEGCSLSPLLSALQSILLARSKRCTTDEVATAAQCENDQWVFDLILMVIHKILVSPVAATAGDVTSETLILEIVCLCGREISSFLAGDVVTIIYSTLLHCPRSSPCWDLKPSPDETAARPSPIQAAWETILPLLFSVLFPITPSGPATETVAFKSGWILALIINKVCSSMPLSLTGLRSLTHSASMQFLRQS